MPGHINLAGNDKADELAKQPIEEDKRSWHKITAEDGRNLLKNNQIEKWQTEYDEMSKEKGKYLSSHGLSRPTWTKKKSKH